MSEWNGQERRKVGGNLLERIHNLELQVTELVLTLKADSNKLDDHMDSVMMILKNQNAILYGDNETTGIREEVNNLKRKEKERQFHLNLVTGAVIGGFFKLIFDFVTRKIGG